MSRIPQKLLLSSNPDFDLPQKDLLAQLLQLQIRRRISPQKTISLSDSFAKENRQCSISTKSLKRHLTRLSARKTLHADPPLLSSLVPVRNSTRKIDIFPVRQKILKNFSSLNKTVPRFKNLKVLRIHVPVEFALLQRIRCLKQLEHLFLPLPFGPLPKVSPLPRYFQSLKRLNVVGHGHSTPAPEQHLPLLSSFFEEFRLLKSLSSLSIYLLNPGYSIIHNTILEKMLSFIQDTRFMNYFLAVSLENLNIDWEVFTETLSKIDFLCLYNSDVPLVNFIHALTPFANERQRICYLELNEDNQVKTLLRACSSLKTLYLSSRFLRQLDDDSKFLELEKLFIRFHEEQAPIFQLNRLLNVLKGVKMLKFLSLRLPASDPSILPVFQQLFEASSLNQLEELRLEIPYRFLSQIVSRLKSLQSLKKLRFKLFYDSEGEWIFSEGYFGNFPHLQSLRINTGMRFSDTFQWSLERLPELRSFTLKTGNGYLSEWNAKRLLEEIKSCSGLENVNLSGNCLGNMKIIEIENSAEEMIKMKNMKEVKLPSINDVEIRRRKWI